MDSAYVHHVPGRLRVRTARIKNDGRAARTAEELLASVAGVQRTAANTVTGSLTLHYDGAKTCVDELLRFLKTHQYVDERVVPIRQRSAWPAGSGEIALSVVSRLAKIAAEKAIERSLMTLVAAVL
jgi:hypothetical protein